jgi:hypothetical protein
MEVVESVESDPWERPYRLVTKKLRPPAAPHPSDRKHETRVARQCHQNFVPTVAEQQGQRQHEADNILPPQPDHGVERRAMSHPKGALRGNKKDGIPPRRNTGTGRNHRPGLGGINEDPGRPPAKPVHQMPEGRSIPPGMEKGEVDPAEQGRTPYGIAVRVQANMPSGRGGQTIRKTNRRPSGGPHDGTCTWGARQPIWISARSIDGGRGKAGDSPWTSQTPSISYSATG